MSRSSVLLQVSSVSSVVSRRREQRVLLMVVIMVLCYLVCWLPYGIMALLSTFRPDELLSPEASIVPSLLAKFSTVVNPFIYIFMNKQVSWTSHNTAKNNFKGYTFAACVIWSSLGKCSTLTVYVHK